MIEFSPSEIAAYYRDRVPQLKQSRAKEWRGPCPLHQGNDDNFAVNSETGQAYCHSQCQRGWDVIDLEMELSRHDFPTAKKEVFALLGREEQEQADHDIVAAYDYTDAHGEILYQVVRRYPKRFAQRRPDGQGNWIWNLGDIERVPYQLPKILESTGPLVIVEGEKDARTLTKRGLLATCNSEGAGKWRPELSQHFRNRLVWILPDNDEQGRQHALKVAASLHGIAKAIKIAELPGLSAKGDVSDFLATGKTIEDVKAVLQSGQVYTPEFQFVKEIPSEEDRWVRTFRDTVQACGGMKEFRNLKRKNGIPTPFATVTDELNGGLQPGEMYLLAGMTGQGKTSLLLQFISKACQARYGVLFFSLEMGDLNVDRRLVAIEERVSLSQYKALQYKEEDGFLTDSDLDTLNALHAKFERGARRAGQYPYMVHQKPAVTPSYLIQEVKRLSARQKIDLLVIDHAQLMQPDDKAGNDYERFTAISRALKGEVARELQIPILLASQVNGNAAYEKRGELILRDLRATGAWAEDSAAVWLLYYDQKHVQELEVQGQLSSGVVKTWLKTGKNRFGPSGNKLELWHSKKFTRFDSRDEQDYEPEQPIAQEEIEAIRRAA